MYGRFGVADDYLQAAQDRASDTKGRLIAALRVPGSFTGTRQLQGECDHVARRSRHIEPIDMISILEAHRGDHLLQARGLFAEYAASLGISLEFQNFQEELANLPGDYAPPEGTILIASWNEEAAGCAALRRMTQDACEMKRLYVSPQFRGIAIGKALAKAVVGEARRIGYRRILLDTLPTMHVAKSLYAELGFRETAAYRYNPVDGSRFLKLELS